MKIGELYCCTLRTRTFYDWQGKVFLYLGESIIRRPDGVTITNHKIHIDGREVLVDRTMLRHFKKVA